MGLWRTTAPKGILEKSIHTFMKYIIHIIGDDEHGSIDSGVLVMVSYCYKRVGLAVAEGSTRSSYLGSS